MGKIVVKNVIEQKPGHMYYLKDGNLYETKMNRKGAKKGHKVCSAPKPVAKKTAKKKVAAKKVKKATKKK